MKIIDGKKLAAQILDEIKKEIEKLPTALGLAVILVGENPASKIYIKKKEEACAKVGINSEKILCDADITDEELIVQIKKLNERDDIHGILIQLPLPKRLDTNKIINIINPKKDVDGFLKESKVVSPTIAGILKLLKSTSAKAGQAGKNLKDKTVMILANSKIFAEPLKNLLEKKDCSVEILIKPRLPTVALAKVGKQKFDADIIIAALGKPKFITADMVRDNTIIIDVGITRVGKKIFGDADQESLKNKPGWITPVPGGVGPMTVAMLLKNLLVLYKEQNPHRSIPQIYTDKVP